MYSVARRRKGLLIGSLPVAVAPEEQRLHGVGAVVARGFRPEERNAIVGRVVLQHHGERAVRVAELHRIHPGLAAVLLQALEQGWS